MSIQNEQWPHASCEHCGADDCPGDCYAGLLARIAELEAKLDPPPEGFPSWEDWLASYGYQVGYASTIDCWILHKPSGNSMQYNDYPAALAAAKKEAGR